MSLKYKSRISILKTIISSLDLLLLIISGSFLIYKGNSVSVWIYVFGILLLFLALLQFSKNLFFLYLTDKELKIIRPFKVFNSNQSFTLSEIREVTFNKGFKSPFMTIRKINSYDENPFVINFSDSEMEKLIAELNNLGVKTIRNNI
ncbi:hypothetical protein ACFPVY_16555 [Flavobacterium qiangtangense]|uniref:PH domain-containing protein n=1 Tax=Flavobacterium qiangtangense TaxID=1442595 RepID=A0ABW1PSP6_9FLAO